MKITLLQAASVIAILQAILMAITMLQNKKTPSPSNGILASMLLIFSIITGCSLYLSISPLKFNAHYHKLLFMLGHLAFLLGPLLYFYVKSLLEIRFSFSKSDWIHLLPCATAVFISIFIIAHSEQFFILNYRGRIYFSGAIVIQSFLYLIASMNLLRSYGLSVVSFLSYIADSRLAWVRFFVSGFIILWLIHFQLFIGWDVLQRPQWCPYVTSLYFLSTFVFFNGMVFLLLKKPEIFHAIQKYQYSILTENEKTEYLNKLNMLMHRETLYRNPSLTLTEIAEKLNIAPRYVSQVINETLQHNFHDYVNKYRIEESKRLLSLPEQQLNIMGIAFDAGFNSKSAFNNAFKKHTGITPKEYKKQLLPTSIS